MTGGFSGDCSSGCLPQIGGIVGAMAWSGSGSEAASEAGRARGTVGSSWVSAGTDAGMELESGPARGSAGGGSKLSNSVSQPVRAGAAVESAAGAVGAGSGGASTASPAGTDEASSGSGASGAGESAATGGAEAGVGSASSSSGSRKAGCAGGGLASVARTGSAAGAAGDSGAERAGGSGAGAGGLEGIHVQVQAIPAVDLRAQVEVVRLGLGLGLPGLGAPVLAAEPTSDRTGGERLGEQAGRTGRWAPTVVPPSVGDPDGRRLPEGALRLGGPERVLGEVVGVGCWALHLGSPCRGGVLG